MKRLAKVVAGSGVLVLCFGALAYATGARINTTRSIPVGLYWTTTKPVERGAYVVVCPPQKEVFDEAVRRDYLGAGMCPGDYGYMMKRILAAKGDLVSVDSDGVQVNGKVLPMSIPLDADGAGRPMPHFRVDQYRLSGDEFLLMGDVTANSFDGRYYGLIGRSQIVSVIRPVITW
ncbi:conjugative transfer signal peptidase TraF [Sedimenticola hydrogenitrophicus]|uniref:conjugative transfer signal peptidase TraF n=1 Tax=Sedimenticola hydrogenitrophicus TaxID=2967975 RepID=UPI0023B05C70